MLLGILVIKENVTYYAFYANSHFVQMHIWLCKALPRGIIKGGPIWYEPRRVAGHRWS